MVPDLVHLFIPDVLGDVLGIDVIFVQPTQDGYQKKMFTMIIF